MTLLSAIVLSACLGCGEHHNPTMSTANIAAEAILAQQTPDGAITMGKIGESDSSVISYFGCFAAQGLVAAYRANHDERLATAVRKWSVWYEAHQNPDGTIYDYAGHSESWKSTNHYDSTDSYAAVYLALLWDIHTAKPDLKWLRQRRRSIDRAIAGIRLTMQPSGLTTAKPTYPVMYTMDNVETLLGLRAANRLALALGDSATAIRADAAASKMARAIDTLLWNSSASCYRVGIQVDGGKMEGLKQWYPDIMANLMAIAWLPPSERNRTLWSDLRRRLGADIPSGIQSMIDLEHLIWWGWAAKGAGDAELLKAIRSRLASFETVCQSGCDAGLLGHIARLSVVP